MARARLAALDALRGTALVAMFAYHLVWDLAFLGLIAVEPSRSYGFRLASHAIASAFLFIAGIAMTLAGGRAPRASRVAWRIGRVGLAAALVTAATAYFAPGLAVTFGMLHCIALALILAALFAPAPTPLVLAGAVAALAAPSLLASPALDAPALQWLGLGTGEPRTLDWRPLLPWAGVTLLGLAAGRARLLLDGLSRGESAAPAGLAFLGRHSLAVYLLHQPAFLAILWLAALALPRISPEAREERDFLGPCVAQCRAGGGAADVCERACGCVVASLKRENLWSATIANRLDAAGKARLGSLAQGCSAR